MIILVTGGERSGKSSYVQRLALSLTAQPVYVVTAKEAATSRIEFAVTKQNVALNGPALKPKNT